MTGFLAPLRPMITRRPSGDTATLMKVLASAPRLIELEVPDGRRTSMAPVARLPHTIVPSFRTAYATHAGDTSLTFPLARSSFASGKWYSRNGPAPPRPVGSLVT